mmetsp:Transcript_617/g.1649  ORF Transcript_617/g.1649 Transcript_617/m.1649 type:complete len:112 (+) Transcript_617:57-392(+)
MAGPCAHFGLPIGRRSDSDGSKSRKAAGRRGDPPLGGALGQCAQTLRAASAQLKQIQQDRMVRAQSGTRRWWAWTDSKATGLDSQADTNSDRSSSASDAQLPVGRKTLISL